MDRGEIAADKLEIQELLYKYGRTCDVGDWAALRSVFTDDGYLDYTSSDCPEGPRDEMVAWLERSLTQLPWRMHYITNIEIEVDGDNATAQAMFYNPMQLPGLTDTSAAGGYYYWTLVRTDDGWKAKRLVEVNVWFVNPLPDRDRAKAETQTQAPAAGS